MCGNPEREASSITRGQEVRVFSWIDFSPQYILGHKVRETYKTKWGASDVGPESIYLIPIKQV